MEGASPTSREVLVRVAWLAQELGAALEDDAINADTLLLWTRYASELEVAIRLASSELSPLEIAKRLDQCVQVIHPPIGLS